MCINTPLIKVKSYFFFRFTLKIDSLNVSAIDLFCKNLIASSLISIPDILMFLLICFRASKFNPILHLCVYLFY